MERRDFFLMAASGVAGITFGTSCQHSSSLKDKNPVQIGGQGSPERREIPTYRRVIKSSFDNNNQKNVSDTIVLALIGAGAWGNYFVSQLLQTGENFRFKYVCDVDDTRGGGIMTALEKKQGFKPIRVRDMRKVFDDREVDAVIITVPEHWHALATIWACQAGKDVYIEKCISHNISDGQKMIEATMKYERIVQCGTHNRSMPGILQAKEYIESGALGDLAAVHVRCLLPGPIPFNEKENSNTPDTIDWDLWLGPAPKVPYNVSRHKSWVYYWDYGGGNALSNEVTHQLDLARLVLGNPEHPSSVYCLGGRYFFDDHRDVPDYQITTFDYGKYAMIVETGDCTSYMGKSGDDVRFTSKFPEWRQNGTRIEIIGTKRMMYIGRMGGGWQVFDKGGKVVAEQQSLYALQDHQINFLDCVRSRKKPNSDIVEGHKSSVMIHLANTSYRVGCKQLDFSPEYEMITNNDKAQELTHYVQRKGFEIPKEI